MQRTRRLLMMVALATIMFIGINTQPASADQEDHALASEWELVNVFVNVRDGQAAWAACHTTGEFGLMRGIWEDFTCDFDGYYTAYLWVLR